MARLTDCPPSQILEVFEHILQAAKMRGGQFSSSVQVTLTREQMRVVWFATQWLETTCLHPAGIATGKWSLQDCMDYLNALILIANPKVNEQKTFQFDGLEIQMIRQCDRYFDQIELLETARNETKTKPANGRRNWKGKGKK